MTLARRVVYLSIVVAVVAIGALLLSTDSPSDGARQGGTARAPDFTAFTLDSPPARRTLADYSGQPVIVNIWATWCDPCREEMPSFERLYRDYESRGLRIVAVSIDDRGATQLVRERRNRMRETRQVARRQRPSTNAAARMDTRERVAFGRPSSSTTDVPETNAR